MDDGFDQFRKTLGADNVDNFLEKFGLGPKYVPTPPKLYDCPKCGGKNARIKERHADTDMNCMTLVCHDCKYEEER